MERLERVAKAVTEGYRAADRSFKAMEEFRSHIPNKGGNDPFEPLLATLTASHLHILESRAWFDLAVTIFGEAKLEAENEDI